MSESTADIPEEAAAELRPKTKVAKGLRLWPGVALVAALWLVRVFSPMIDTPLFKFILPVLYAPLIALLGVLIWWLFASRL